MRQLQSEAMALQLVRRAQTDVPKSDSRHYRTAQNVASYARQAIGFAKSAETAPLEVLPVLRYYQWLHTLKTILYLFHPKFPESTSVLQHGLSVRRIKKANYSWPLEKILVHKEGIIQSFHRLFSGGETYRELPDKILIGDLIGSVPQLASLIRQFYDHFEHAYPLRYVSSTAEAALGDVQMLGADATNMSRTSGLGDPLYGSGAKDPVRNRYDCLVSRRIASNQGLTVEEWRQQYYDNAPMFTIEAENVSGKNRGGIRKDNKSSQERGYLSEMGGASEREGASAKEGASKSGAAPKSGGASQRGSISSEERDRRSQHQTAHLAKDPKGYIRIAVPSKQHPLFSTYDGVDFLMDDPSYPIYLVHYTLLYGLSALCRYSAAEWSDIVHWHDEVDALLVREYLRLPLPRPIIYLEGPEGFDAPDIGAYDYADADSAESFSFHRHDTRIDSVNETSLNVHSVRWVADGKLALQGYNNPH